MKAAKTSSTEAVHLLLNMDSSNGDRVRADPNLTDENGLTALAFSLHTRKIMMGVGNRVASVIMLTFPSEPCPHADFSKGALPPC